MESSIQYSIALIAAALVTGGVALVHRSIVLLLGIFVIYTIGIGITLQYPALLWGRDFSARLPTAVLGGGTTFGVLSLAQGLGPEVHIGAGVLGLGLTVFGAVTGVWLAEASDG